MRYRLAKCKELLKPGMVLIVALIFLGCIGIGMPANSEAAGEDRYYETDYDTVWNAAIAAFHEEKFIIRLMNKEAGYITADWQEDRTKYHIGIWISKEYGLIKVSINRTTEYLAYKEKTKTYIWESSSYDYNEYMHDAITSKVLNISDHQWKGTKEGKEIKLALKKAKEEFASHIKKAQDFLEEFSAFVDKNAKKGNDTALIKLKEEFASHIKKAQGMLEGLSILTDKDVKKRGGLAVIKTLITNIKEELETQAKMVRQMREELSRLADKKEALP